MLRRRRYDQSPSYDQLSHKVPTYEGFTHELFWSDRSSGKCDVIGQKSVSETASCVQAILNLWRKSGGRLKPVGYLIFDQLNVNLGQKI